ncbi:hypothetical protein ACJ72_01936 [Emergomyces africanus]|uniref:C2H2-type domain-containing protein n=1 Tax=Emergomyces africanus TaxID=1955775 RepID=A0A1B7P3U9_9EURO|nr:hypothetical protein ACJ72_01936 [Emergomyces africanus]
MAWCTLCQRSFKAKANLKQHIQNSSAHASTHDSDALHRSSTSKDARTQKSSAHTRSYGERWSMYPTHHQSVSCLLEEDDLYFNFHGIDDNIRCNKSHDTNIMGRFTCHNKSCTSNGWSSKRIAITIRMYPGEKYNARVYHQRCKSCKGLSQPLLDESYADRVAYRIKKWRGIHVEVPEYSGKSKGPHNSYLCEGCKDGHCNAIQRSGIWTIG